MISNKKKAVIHIAKSQVGMSDEEYRDLLGSVGVESSADPRMSDSDFDVIMARFKALGFKRVAKKARKPKRPIDNLPISKRKLMQKLEAILLDLDLPWEYADGIAKKRFGIDRAQWLEADNLYKLVQMMTIHQQRKRRA